MNVISMVLLAFAVLGGIDRIIGNRFGLGKEFERGFMLLGNMALSMIGMIVISPLIADLLAPCFDWFYNVLHIDPSVIPASVFANDMGGASLSAEVARDKDLGMFNALVVSSVMGCTISFSIPYGLGVVKKEHHKDMFLGMLCGIATIPLGCFVSGLSLGIPVLSVLLNLLPIILLSGIVACGLILAPAATIKAFSALGIIMKTAITLGLLVGMFQSLTGIVLIKGLADIKEGADICFNAAVVLAGAFPFMAVVSRVLNKPITKFGQLLGINAQSAMGLVSTTVTNSTTFEMLNGMERNGIVLNSAFLVSAAFTLGSHLAFTMAFDAGYVLPMILAKLLSGVTSIPLALLIYKRVCK